MTTRTPKLLLLALLILTASSLPAKTVKVGDREVDSVLLAYFSRCNKIVREADILATADTLFHLAAEKNDRRMQAAALSYKVNHYFYTGPKDSLLYWIGRGKEFCRANKEFTHYYFMWNRLVSWHIKRREFNLALNEIRQLQAQATADDFKPAIGNSYERLGEIFYAKNNISAAIEQYEKAIDFYRSNQVENYNAIILYSNTAAAYASARLFDKALATLDAAEEKVVLPSQHWQLKIRRLSTYILMGEASRAAPLLDECLEAEKAGALPSSTRTLLHENLGLYYLQTNRPDKALEIFEQQLAIIDSTGDNPETYTPFLTKILSATRMLGDTAAYYRTDSLYHYAIQYLNNQECNTAVGEFAALLNVEKLNRENAEMELAAQQQKLRNNIFTIAILAVVLVISILFGLIQSRTSRRLRLSQQAVMRKNEELKRSEESLLAAKNEAEKASGMKTVFIRNVTHEIHTPLNAIVGFAPLVADKIAPHDAEARAYMEIVQDNSRYLQKLVEDVLTLSDMESLAGSPSTGEVDVDEVCRRSLERAGTGRPGVEIRYEGTPLHLKTNALCLSQVLTNLLHNSLKFTQSGMIELTCRADTAHATAEFTVTDTGCGIPIQESERIFDRFVKLDEFSQGMGIGLAVCRVIVEKLGGTIRLDSSYTQGARFVVRLPLHG